MSQDQPTPADVQVLAEAMQPRTKRQPFRGHQPTPEEGAKWGGIADEIERRLVTEKQDEAKPSRTEWSLTVE